MRLSVGSLFAGIGGFDLGFERAGFEIKWQVENDEFAVRVLRKHWPDIQRYGDITVIDWSAVERVDVLCGGFPCQPVSFAGLGLIEADERWLWPDFAGAIRHLRPRYVVMENVAALLSRGFGEVVGELAAAGYDAEWLCVEARDVGAPHERDRLFLVAYPDEGDGQAGMGHLAHRSRPILAGDHPQRADFWLQAPREALGMDDGIRGRAYERRVGAIGNSIVPQIAEWIARRILQAEEWITR